MPQRPALQVPTADKLRVVLLSIPESWSFSLRASAWSERTIEPRNLIYGRDLTPIMLGKKDLLLADDLRKVHSSETVSTLVK